MLAKDYRPAHGGYPAARRRRRRGAIAARGAAIVNLSTPPGPPPGPNMTLVHEAYARGVRDGRAGGGPGWGNR